MRTDHSNRYSGSKGFRPPVTFHFDPTSGSDTNDGLTAATPWLTYLNFYKVVPGYDNVQVLVAGVWKTSSADVASLTEYWDSGDVVGAVGDSVGTWTGRNAGTATQATGSAQPTVAVDEITGRTMLHFVGSSSQVLVAGAIHIPTTEGTLVVVYRPNNPGATQYFAGGWTWVSNNYDGLGVGSHSILPNFKVIHDGNGIDAGTITMAAYTRHMAIAGYKTADTYYGRWDGAQLIGASCTNAVPANIDLAIGANMDNTTPGGFCTADLMAVLVFSTKLTAAEIFLVELDMALRWKVPLSPYIWSEQFEYGFDEAYRFLANMSPTDNNEAERVADGRLNYPKNIRGATGKYCAQSLQYISGSSESCAKLCRSFEYKDTGRIDGYFSARVMFSTIPTISSGADTLFQAKSFLPSDPIVVMSMGIGTGAIFAYKFYGTPGNLTALTTVPTPIAGQWYRWEMYYKWHATTGAVGLWIDAVKYFEDINVNTTLGNGGVPVDFIIGRYWGTSVVSPMPGWMFIEDVAICTAQRWT